MRGASTIAVVILIGSFGDARAGETRAAPPVRVVSPLGQAGAKLERDDLPVPTLEVTKHPVKIEAPAVPSFELPATDPGFHAAQELRVHGKHLLGSEIKVKGYVTWVYDCGGE